MTPLDELTQDDALAAFRRYRWLAIEEYQRGDHVAALDRLGSASDLADRIRELGGKVPF